MMGSAPHKQIENIMSQIERFLQAVFFFERLECQYSVIVRGKAVKLSFLTQENR